MRHEIVVLSDDLKHDTFAVASFEKVAVAELQACGVEFEVLIEFDDGAASQYKCINSFEDISKSVSRLGVKVKRAYFGAQHGKGQSDGATAVVKSSVRRAVIQGENIPDAAAMYSYCKENLARPRPASMEPEECCHSRCIHFIMCQVSTGRTSTLHCQ